MPGRGECRSNAVIAAPFPQRCQSQEFLGPERMRAPAFRAIMRAAPAEMRPS